MSDTAGVLVRRGLRRRCPVCGGGNLFRAWVRMVPACPGCGLVFDRIPGHWLGSWFLNVCVVQAVVLGTLIVGVGVTWPDPPVFAIATGAALAAVVTPIAFFPISRTLWTSIDLVMRPLDFDDGVAPGFVLAADAEQLERERRARDAEGSAGSDDGRDDLDGPADDDR